MYAVILAGGGGTRLWPLSSPERPKPFLPLLGERTLLQLTADRLKGLIEPGSVFVVTDQRYVDLVREQLPDVGILAEPVGRNTAPAIALATVAIPRPHDQVMLVLPADQTVKDELQFHGVVRAAQDELALGSLASLPLVTLGVETTRAATEYGYLIPNVDKSQKLELTAYVLKAFEEKPSLERANELWRQGSGIAWNAGMFMWQRGAIRSALERFAPQVFDPVEAAWRSGSVDGSYAEVPSISIDYAVMEPAAAAGLVVMGAMNVGWNDLGSWTSLLGALGMPGIEATIDLTGKSFEAAADDLLVWRRASGRLIATPGGDATMVSSDGPVAVLRGARRLQSRIEPLLDRCSTPEAHS
jgi:mannose-1-phosphate guanylyltransferase